MFKKDYYIYLKERNVKAGDDYCEWIGVVRAKNALEAFILCNDIDLGLPREKYYLVEIKKI